VKPLFDFDAVAIKTTEAPAANLRYRRLEQPAMMRGVS